MTRQLDPTILRFFTVSRIISPASEMCLCKFHIEIENFLTRRRPPCAQTLSALRFLPIHSPFTHQTHHYNPHFTTILHYSSHAFSKASFSRPRISASAFPAISHPSENQPKASLSPSGNQPQFSLCISLRKGVARTLIRTTDFPCFLSFSFYLHICLCFVLYFKVFSKCPIHSFIFFHMVFRIRSFTNPIYGLGRLQNGFHRRDSGDCIYQYRGNALVEVYGYFVNIGLVLQCLPLPTYILLTIQSS